MTLQRRAWILDVGHGNSTVVEESDRVSIIDGGSGDTLLRFLYDRGITRVDTIIVSHVDADHFGGISLLLSSTDFQVGQVFVNPDPRETALWRDFVSVMIDAKGRGAEFKLELTNVNPGVLASNGIRLEVLAPSQELASKTPRGHAPDGGRMTPNTMSAVVRVWAGDSPRLLIAGDIDQAGLDSLMGDATDMGADVLVFPHHGGSPGKANPAAFAESLIRVVGAKLVIFSIGRGGSRTPHPDIVAAVMGAIDGVHIACTQLSTQCADDLPAVSSYLHTAIARGFSGNACCAGTIEVSLEDDNVYTPARSAHLEFIYQNAPNALCRRYNSRHRGMLLPGDAGE